MRRRDPARQLDHTNIAGVRNVIALENNIVTTKITVGKDYGRARESPRKGLLENKKTVTDPACRDRETAATGHVPSSITTVPGPDPARRDRETVATGPGSVGRRLAERRAKRLSQDGRNSQSAGSDEDS